LYPRQRFYLEKYLADKTVFGTAQLHQGGRWQMLFPYWTLWICLVAFSGLIILGVNRTILEQKDLWLLVVLFPAVIFAFIRFRVHSFRLMANLKTAGGTGFHSAPDIWKISRIYFLGYGLTLAATGVIGALFVFITLVHRDCVAVEQFAPGMCGAVETVPSPVVCALAFITGFAAVFLWVVLKQVLVTLPVLRQYSGTLAITGHRYLHGVTSGTGRRK
jgi:hypothetical protein